MLLAFVVAVGGAGAAGYWKGGKDTGNRIAADLALSAEATREAQQQALTAAAEQIAKLDVETRVIRQKTEVITREVPVYRDCRHSPDGLQNVNEALTGEGPATGDRQLPALDAPKR
jgi:hypothetical protein